MNKIYSFLFIGFVFIGCTVKPDFTSDYYSPVDNWNLPEEIKPQNIYEVLNITSKIIWTSDNGLDDKWNNFVKTPNETYSSKTGDCDDISLLAMELIKIMQNGDTSNIRFIIGKVTNKLNPDEIVNHAWIEYNGRFVEPQSYYLRFNWNIISIDCSYTYDEMVEFMKKDNNPEMNLRSIK
jgi:hypothetical protein